MSLPQYEGSLIEWLSKAAYAAMVAGFVWVWRMNTRVKTLEDASMMALERHNSCSARTSDSLEKLFDLTRTISNSVARIEGKLDKDA